jgi:hypothetical protein
MFTTDDETLPNPDCSLGSVTGDTHPLIHLLPRLKEYLAIVDPDRVEAAMELLVNCQTEAELFDDLQTQYGDLPVEATEGLESSVRPITEAVDPEKHKRSKRIKSGSEDSAGRKSKAHRTREAEDEELSDFIVPDTDEDGAVGEEEESEFSESESDIEEPEPEDLSKRKLSPRGIPVPSSPPPRPPMPTRLSNGPSVLCKYGKACYRKNPVHFREFAHPWLLNQPGDI